jgi:hypothetical protein
MRRKTCGALVLGGAFLSWPRDASAADTTIGLDADGALPTTDNRLLDGGGGFGIRLGSQAHLSMLRLTGEIGYGYERLFADQAPSDWTTHRAFIGGRVGIGRPRRRRRPRPEPRRHRGWSPCRLRVDRRAAFRSAMGDPRARRDPRLLTDCIRSATTRHSSWQECSPPGEFRFCEQSDRGLGASRGHASGIGHGRSSWRAACDGALLVVPMPAPRAVRDVARMEVWP